MDAETRQRLEAALATMTDEGEHYIGCRCVTCRVLAELRAVLAALPAESPRPPDSVPRSLHDIWYAGYAAALAAQPPDLVALVREWQAADAANEQDRTYATIGRRARAEAALLGYPLPEGTEPR